MSSPVESQKHTIKYQFENAPNLNEIMKYSEIFELNDTKWKFGIKVTQNKMNVFLNCLSLENEKGKILAVDAEFVWMRQIGENDHFRKNLTKTEYYVDGDSEKGIVFDSFYWPHINEPNCRFLKNNSIKLEVNFEFFVHDFSKKIDNYTDIILKVENVDLHINKGVLCFSSEYFYNRLINSPKNEENTEIVAIDDVKVVDFMKLLLFLNPNTAFLPSKLVTFLNSEDLETYFLLADRFKIKAVHSKIALALKSIFENSQYFVASPVLLDFTIKCIEFADQYDYPILFETCLDYFKSAHDIKFAAKTPEFDGLSQYSKVQLLRRLLKF